MSPVEIRDSVNELIRAFRSSWGDTRKANAEHLRKAIAAHRFVLDQVPNDVLDRIYGLYGQEKC